MLPPDFGKNPHSARSAALRPHIRSSVTGKTVGAYSSSFRSAARGLPSPRRKRKLSPTVSSLMPQPRVLLPVIAFQISLLSYHIRTHLSTVFCKMRVCGSAERRLPRRKYTACKDSPAKSQYVHAACGRHSLRSAMTGSFFAAALAGISPETRVRTTETHTIARARYQGRAASPAIPVSGVRIRLMMIWKR